MISVVNKLSLPLLLSIQLITSCNRNQQENSIIDIESQKAKSVKDNGSIVSSLSDNITCMLQDKNGNYWFGTSNEGLYLYNNTTLTQFTNKNNLCGNTILTIQEDAEGNLWVETNNSICKYDGISFQNLSGSLKSATQKQIENNNKNLFFNYQGNMYQFNGNSFSQFSIAPKEYVQQTTNLDTPYGVYCTLKDKSGNIWFGTDQKGVALFNGKSITFLTDKGLDSAAVRSLYEDRNGNIWFGNNGYGLFCYDGKKIRNLTQEYNLGNEDFLKKNTKSTLAEPNLARVWAINEDDIGTIWIGTIDSGVWSYAEEHFINYSTKDGLPTNAITSIYKDKKGELSFITENEGVYKFNGNRFEKLKP